ncbi:hypothetical protein CBM2585_A130067 [Cupriavidus taiwanensis]|nr:hypothetical protein CBM2585_A130067 [Cupriavidus taiwanensis]
MTRLNARNGTAFCGDIGRMTPWVFRHDLCASEKTESPQPRMLRGLIECWAPGREASAGTMDVSAYPAKLGSAHQSLIYEALANRDVAHALQDGNPGRAYAARLRG